MILFLLKNKWIIHRESAALKFLINLGNITVTDGEKLKAIFYIRNFDSKFLNFKIQFYSAN